MKHSDKDLKKEFQIERLVLFSDAVFAIAITLLIIEIKLPDVIKPYNDRGMLYVLSNILLAKFIGFVVSFIVIAMYWVNHHLLFGYLTNYSKKVIWANMFFLLTIVFMPFSSALYSEFWYDGFITPIAFYSINIMLSGIMIVRLWNIITNPANKLCGELPPPTVIRYYKVRSLAAPAVFMLAFATAYFSMFVSYMMPLIIPVVLRLIKRYFHKKDPQVFYKGSDY